MNKQHDPNNNMNKDRSKEPVKNPTDKDVSQKSRQDRDVEEKKIRE